MIFNLYPERILLKIREVSYHNNNNNNNNNSYLVIIRRLLRSELHNKDEV
jgi:hypothetical protein